MSGRAVSAALAHSALNSALKVVASSAEARSAESLFTLFRTSTSAAIPHGRHAVVKTETAFFFLFFFYITWKIQRAQS